VTTPSDKLAYGVDELAVLAGCGRDKLYQTIRDGHLVARKLGRRTLIKVDAEHRFLDGLPPLRLPLGG
jgi:excisionase family DNA binding protein